MKLSKINYDDLTVRDFTELCLNALEQAYRRNGSLAKMEVNGGFQSIAAMESFLRSKGMTILSSKARRSYIRVRGRKNRNYLFTKFMLGNCDDGLLGIVLHLRDDGYIFARRDDNYSSNVRSWIH